ncbi:hypothetical protein GCM10022276_27280 [Sphingomonas limnosediminicola]|uniref:Uncharacterized protein n=1 Tax=Sphingomonas limnosediminicola TaxID=940133 RepID=A0ABP7LW49_9SPHN
MGAADATTGTATRGVAAAKAGTGEIASAAIAAPTSIQFFTALNLKSSFADTTLQWGQRFKNSIEKQGESEFAGILFKTGTLPPPDGTEWAAP